MDDITTRTIIIAVNIFITIAIVSLVTITFFQMKEIYGVVATTDTSIYNKFDDIYSMYHGKEETGIGLLNALKKYEDSKEQKVIITYNGYQEVRNELKENEREVVKLKELMKQGKDYNFEDRYNVTVSEIDNEILNIDFSRVIQVKK